MGREWVCKKLGYITEQEAKELGFTHHGRYYGIPMWLAPREPDFPVAAKWHPLHYLMFVLFYVEALLRSTFSSDDPHFAFHIGDKIK